MTAPKVKTYEVVGSGEFPLDMLRYDQAWFASEAQANIVQHSYTNGDRFTRRTVTVSSHKLPTVGRWASFGWTVSDTSGLNR